MKTFDIQFNDSSDSDSKGFKVSEEYAREHVKNNNHGSHDISSVWHSYKLTGGTVSIVCNETGETVHEEPVK